MLEIHCIKNARNEKSTFDLRFGHSAIWVSHIYISNQWLKSMFSLFKRLRFGRYINLLEIRGLRLIINLEICHILQVHKTQKLFIHFNSTLIFSPMNALIYVDIRIYYKANFEAFAESFHKLP